MIENETKDNMSKISKDGAVAILKKRIDEIPEVIKQTQFSSRYKLWIGGVETAIIRFFGESSKYYHEFKQIEYGYQISDVEHSFENKVYDAKVILEGMLNEINDYWVNDKDGKSNTPENYQKQKLENLLSQINEFKNQFKKNSFGLDSIDGDEFRQWLADIKVLVVSLKQDKVTESIIKLVNGFNGWSDRPNFLNLCSELNAINKNFHTYYIMNTIPKEKNNIDISISYIERICDRFHLVVKQLELDNRHDNKNRTTIEIKDEYDVQDLLHSLLRLYFDNVLDEDTIPKFAGKSSRIDFLLPKERIGIEVKHTRDKLTDTKLRDELILDIAQYKKHPDCENLVCFIYDPAGYIKNPHAIIDDLEEDKNIFVKVIINQ